MVSVALQGEGDRPRLGQLGAAAAAQAKVVARWDATAATAAFKILVARWTRGGARAPASFHKIVHGMGILDTSTC